MKDDDVTNAADGSAGAANRGVARCGIQFLDGSGFLDASFDGEDLVPAARYRFKSGCETGNNGSPLQSVWTAK